LALISVQKKGEDVYVMNDEMGEKADEVAPIEKGNRGHKARGRLAANEDSGT